MLTALLVMTVLTAQDGHAPTAVDVRTILTTKCGECHGTSVAKPRGKFGFVNDLARLREDPEFLLPGEPDDSEVWVQIDDGKMPPKRSKAGALAAEEKQAIHDWIKGGAVVPADLPPEPAPVVVQRSLFSRGAELLGKFHIITIHFPIALLIAAAAGEFWGMIRKQRTPLSAVRFCVGLGAIAAVVAGALGWLHAFYLVDQPDQLLMLHRWIGTGAGVLAPGVWWLSERDVKGGARRGITRWAIMGLGALVGLAGHFGGLLVYGEGFYSL